MSVYWGWEAAQEYAVVAVDFLEADLNDVGFIGVDFDGDVICLNGIFVHAAVYEGEEADEFWAAEIDYLVEGGADGAAGEEDVVYEDDFLSGYVEAYVCAADDGLGAEGAEVVAVEGDVDFADGNVVVKFFGEDFDEAVGQVGSAGADSE